MSNQVTITLPNGAVNKVSRFHRFQAIYFWTSESGMERSEVMFGTHTKEELDSKLPRWPANEGQTLFVSDLAEIEVAS